MNSYLALSFDSPELIVWSVCIGFNIAIVITYILKLATEMFVLKLFKHGANSEKTAVSLKELREENNKLLPLFLREGSSLRSVVSMVTVPVEETQHSDKEKPRKKHDFANSRFYITEDKTKKAESMIKGRFKWYFLPICGALSVIITVILIALLPILTNF